MKEQSIKKNYLYYTFYQILSFITPFVTVPYASRIFGATGIGVQSYTNSVVSYFVLFSALGTASYGQREIAQHRDDKHEVSKLFWEIELLSAVMTLICLGVWTVYLWTGPEYLPYYLVETMTIVAVIFDISWFFGGFEQFKLIVLRNTVVKMIGIACLFLFVKQKNDLLLYIALIAATGMFGNLSMWTYLPRFVEKIPFRDLDIFRHFKPTLTYFIPTIATSVYSILDKTMIGAITHDTAQNGYYEQTTGIVKMSLTIITSLNTVMGARMSYLFSQNKIEEIKSRLRTSMDFTLILGIPMIFGLCGIARNFVPWFLGKGFEECIYLIYIYSLLILPIGISNCLGGQYLTPSGQRARSSKGIITGAVVNFCLNSLMIPYMAARGAAIASVIAEMVIAIIYVYMSKGYMSWRTIITLAYKRVIAGLIMFAAVLAIGRGHSGSIAVTLIQIAAGAAVYALVLHLWHDPFLESTLQNGMARIRARRHNKEGKNA